jgi:uncharacterized protein YndB with AHSA1/START domain
MFKLFRRKKKSDSKPPQVQMRDIVLTRTFAAPRERVFETWSDPEQVKRWFGPKTFTTPICSIDFREGGILHLAMRAPDGQDYWVRGVYREIVRPQRIVYLDSFSDKDGNVVAPEDYGMSPGWPKEAPVTVTFDEQNGQTRMTMRAQAPAGKESEQAEQGWNESFDKLEAYLRQ